MKRRIIKKAAALQKALESVKGRVEALNERIYNEYSCQSDQVRVSDGFLEHVKDAADYAGILVRILENENNAED